MDRELLFPGKGIDGNKLGGLLHEAHGIPRQAFFGSVSSGLFQLGDRGTALPSLLGCKGRCTNNEKEKPSRYTRGTHAAMLSSSDKKYENGVFLEQKYDEYATMAWYDSFVVVVRFVARFVRGKNNKMSVRGGTVRDVVSQSVRF